jgi:hypothetical protein
MFLILGICWQKVEGKSGEPHFFNQAKNLRYSVDVILLLTNFSKITYTIFHVFTQSTTTQKKNNLQEKICEIF